MVACIPDRPESQLSAICRSSHLHGQRILGTLLQSLWQGVDSLTVPEVLAHSTLVTDEIVAVFHRHRMLVQLMKLEEVPQFLGRIYPVRIIGMPMSLTVDGYQGYLYPVVHIIIYSACGFRTCAIGRIRADYLRVACITSLVGSPLLYIFLNARITASHVIRIARIFEHIITGSVNMHDRHLAVSFRLLTDIHTTNRSESGNLITQGFQAVIAQPTAHGEAREIDTVLIHIVLQLHILHDSLHKLHITRTAGIPHSVITQRIGNDKTFGISQRTPLRLLLLILRVLIHTMKRDYQGW